MGIFDVLGGVVALPVAIASDAAKQVSDAVTGEVSPSDTKKVIKNIVESTKKDQK